MKTKKKCFRAQVCYSIEDRHFPGNIRISLGKSTYICDFGSGHHPGLDTDITDWDVLFPRPFPVATVGKPQVVISA